MAFEVSAVIPHFEREELLAQTLESIVNQSEPPAEIIVVDDGSRRPPESVCRRFGAQLLSIPHTGKPGAVRNRGVEAAVSQWIAFADSDDLWLPEKLKTQRLRLERDAFGTRWRNSIVSHSGNLAAKWGDGQPKKAKTPP